MGKDFNLYRAIDITPPPPNYTSESVLPPVTEIRIEAPHQPSFEEQYPGWRTANADDLAGDHTWQEQANAQNEAIETDTSLNEPMYAGSPPDLPENEEVGENLNGDAIQEIETDQSMIIESPTNIEPPPTVDLPATCELPIDFVM